MLRRSAGSGGKCRPKFLIENLTLMRLLRILLSALPVLIVACGGKEPAPDPVILAANPAELEFGPEGGTQTLTITSGIQPAVSSLGDG